MKGLPLIFIFALLSGSERNIQVAGLIGSSFQMNKIIKVCADNQRQYFNAPEITGREDEFCRRAYLVMLKGAYFCKDLYQEWPDEPGCGFIGWGGQGEKDIFANLGFVHLYAMLITFGNYDENVTGISKEEALRRVKGVIRYSCFTGIGERSSWSTIFSQTVWLMWHELDENTQEMAARLIVQDADRFIGVNPESGKIDNTVAESNAWSTRSMAIASVMFPDHPHAPLWQETCRRWMMNVFSIAGDKEDTSMVDGKPVQEWVITENIHPDFTLENHRIIHPVYMWASMNGLVMSGSYYLAANVMPPQATFHHMKDVYKVYKKLQTWEGMPAYINGNDKFLHMQVVDINVHSFFAQVLKDPEAVYLEALELDFLERMQARFTDGRLYPVEEVGIRSRVNNLGVHLGTSYLLHYVLQSKIEPVTEDEFEQQISGVTYYPDGKFILHRTIDKLVSFAWTKPYRVMGLTIPRNGSWLVTPCPYGFVGKILEERSTESDIIDIKKLEKEIRDNSFKISMKALRCGGKVEHFLTFESLPGNEVAMYQKLTALEDIVIESAETGSVGIGRELGSDTVILRSVRGVQSVAGPSDQEEELFTFYDGMVTVGDRFTYQWTGSGKVCYQKRGYKTVHGAPEGYGHYEDILFIRSNSGNYVAGEIIVEGELMITMHSLNK